MRPGSSKPPEPPKAAAICAQFELGEDACALLEPDDSADYFLTTLIENRLFVDALRFTAYRFSKREAVWWGCLCAWEVCRPKPKQVVSTALQACALWVKDPSEENRRATQAAGDAALGTPAGSLALATFLSGGSMSEPNLPVVEPGPLLTAKLVAEAVLHASRQVPETPACQRRFLGIASEIALGKVPTPGREGKPLAGKASK